MRAPRRPPPCQICGHAFAPDEMVRLIYKSVTDAPFLVIPLVWTPICVGCFDPDNDSPHGDELKYYERRCAACRQPMLAPSWVTTCSNGCAQHLRRQRRNRRDPEAIRCALCGTSFVPTRSDAQFHSNACRQWAYRQRRRPVTQQSRPALSGTREVAIRRGINRTLSTMRFV